MTCLDTPSIISLPGSVDGPPPCVSPDGPTSDLFGQHPARANRSRSRVKEPEPMTQGTCGRTYCVSGALSGPLSVWESRLRERLAMVGSTECALIWRTKVTPAGQSISRLSRSTRHTNGTGCIGSPWPTPTIADVTGGRKHRSGGRSGEMLLNGLMSAPWITASARDWKDTAGMATQRPDGGTRIDQLPRQMIAAQTAASGPVPTGSSATTVKRAGGTRPHFGFRHIKPGLMPSAIEASFFEGAIANYRQLLSLVMEALDPRDIPTHQ